MENFYKGNGDKYNIFNVLFEMIRSLKEYDSKLYYIIYLISFTSSLVVIGSIFFQKYFVSILQSSTDFKKIIIYSLSYIIMMTIIKCIDDYSRSYYEPRIGECRVNYQTNILNKYMNIKYEYMEDSDFLDYMDSVNRSTIGNNWGVELLYQIIYRMPSTIIIIIFLIVVLGISSPIILIISLLNLLIELKINDSRDKIDFNYNEEENNISRNYKYYSKISSKFEYGKDIRIFNLYELISNNYQNEIKKYNDLKLFIENKKFKYSLLSCISLFLGNVFIYSILIYKSSLGMELSTFAMNLTGIIYLNSTLHILFSDISAIMSEGRFVSKAISFMSMKDYDIKKNNLEKENCFEENNNDNIQIKLEDVSFRYPRSDRNVYNSLSLNIKKGEKLAIVGLNGAGKTTLANLILGFFKVQSGSVLIDNININKFKNNLLLRKYSAVFQEPYIMPFNLRTNISLRDYSWENKESTNVSNEVENIKIWNILNQVGLEEKVKSFHNSINQNLNKTIYNDGVNLSGGEIQKVTIARALYKDSNIIIFDEPTASLDALAEDKIYNELNEIIGNRTAIFISHRLSSTKFCDRIALIDHGKVVEIGTHDELMSMKNKYYTLFLLQGKYYRIGET